jgi:hypothetical protein
LEEALTKWEPMSDKQFSRQPSAEQWSAKQCLAHLNSYGDYYLPAIEHAITTASGRAKKPAVEFRPGWLGDYFTRLMEPASVGRPAKKMKAFKAYIHSNDKDGRIVVREFISQQEKMLALFDQAAHINLDAIRIGISIAPFIRLKLGDVFRFVNAHIARHLQQAGKATRQTDSFAVEIPGVLAK